jgi:hypothetical protein
VVRGLVRDRAGLGPVDPVDMRGRLRLDLAVRHRRGPVDMRDRLRPHPVGPVDRRTGHRVDLVRRRLAVLVDQADRGMRHRVDPRPVDRGMRHRVDPRPVDRVHRGMRHRVHLAVPVLPADRVDMDLLDHRRRHTGPGVSTARVVPRWAAPTMRRTASAHPITVRRLRRRNADSAGITGLLPGGRRLTGSGRRPRVAGTDLRLPVVGTLDGTGRRAT